MDAEREARGAARRPRRDAGRDRRERDPLGRAGRGHRARPRPHHPVGEGLRRAGPGRRVPAARAALRPPAPPRPHRGGHGDEGHRRRARRACRSSSRRASATRSASPSRRARAATGPRRSRSPSRSSSRSGSGSSRPRSPPAPAAGGRRRRSSRRWREEIQGYLPHARCLAGASATAAPRPSGVAVMGCVVNGPGESSTPTSASRSRDVRGAGGAGVRRREAPASRSAATRSSPTSCGSSRTTSTRASARRQPAAR